ncbi:hypothetical protein [Levilactobacillus wangkuiensis]|uniref:hypothetical protein n=1 Tax=Levilactobacillus wangkuiensis TaxID=2799566 RepID=UPI001941D60F|nr:hypothetical protein [Levilactobacillus wangkuiensis]
MTQVSIGKDKLVKVLIGNKVIWEQPDYANTWFHCPFGIGLNTLMMFEPGTNTGYFVVDGGYISISNGSAVTDRLMLELPKGFRFGDNNPKTISMSSNVDGSCEATYNGNKLYVKFGNYGQSTINGSIRSLYLKNGTIWGYQFNVIKED